MIYAVTGPRPLKIRNYNFAVERELRAFCFYTLAILLPRPTGILCGMATGFDTAMGLAAIGLGIPLEAYIPFTQQTSGPDWSDRDRRIHEWICSQSVGVVYLCATDGYPANTAPLFKARNDAMVRACDLLLALDNNTGGGTGHAVECARIRRRPITNLRSDWATWRAITEIRS